LIFVVAAVVAAADVCPFLCVTKIHARFLESGEALKATVATVKKDLSKSRKGNILGFIFNSGNFIFFSIF